MKCVNYLANSLPVHNNYSQRKQKQDCVARSDTFSTSEFLSMASVPLSRAVQLSDVFPMPSVNSTTKLPSLLSLTKPTQS